MSLVEVLPNVQALSRHDKLQLIRYLAHELEQDVDSLLKAGESYPVWSPESAHEAAAVLLEALSKDARS